MSLHQARWIVKTAALLALVVLVMAFQISPAAAPAPEMAASLVSFTLFPLPAEPPGAAEAAPAEPITTDPLPTPTPTAPMPTPTSIPVMPAPTPTESLDALVLRRVNAARTTPVPSFAPPSAAPFFPPAPDGTLRVARVPILMYHYISDPPPGSDQLRRSLSVTPANLDAQMHYLKQAGYQTITLYDLYDHLAQGKPLPDKPIVLTFDDGYEDAFTNAMPILLKYGFVGTFFVLTGPADRDGAGAYLTWKQIAAMSAAGMDMELHGREHVDLRNRSFEFLVHQTAGGRESIEAHTGKPVRWFAYPSGRYDAAVVRVLKSAGFWGAVTTLSGQTHTVDGLFDLERVRISGSSSLETFKKAIEGNE